MNDFINPFWQKVNQQVENDIIRTKSETFLQHPVIQNCMYVTDDSRTRMQLEYIVNAKGIDFANRILSGEPRVGGPDIQPRYYGIICSVNSIQMLYHLVYWERMADRKLESLTSVLEWGAGYGALARLLIKINPNLDYTVIDTPTFSRLQKFYLSQVIDLEHVNLSLYNTDQIASMKLLDKPRDLFISTWALSECPPSTVDFVAAKPGVAQTEHVLLAYQQNNELFPEAENVVKVMNQYRNRKINTVAPVSYLPAGSNYYATC